eukprot:CAMPEP_0196171074 /NCGR_PEP_ID=MMETSP0911-20130528/5198_1 /TAXON_ID=49265 /ORGANISM="Thalassiosira rotula, Strain GSO102" /LENGTH=57 /DNA_ID=CAMNT_0041437807 /DNA_START=200 /DNA_END=369 /DNA_ORIENTATION=-
MPVPMEKLIHLHTGTFLFYWRNKKGILATKEVADGIVCLFVLRPHAFSNEVIPIHPL